MQGFLPSLSVTCGRLIHCNFNSIFSGFQLLFKNTFIWKHEIKEGKKNLCNVTGRLVKTDF